MTRWRALHVGIEGDDATIGDIAVWRNDWRRGGEEAVHLPHPHYPHQRHRFDVYDVGPQGGERRFAAAELSNGVWAFYVPA